MSSKISQITDAQVPRTKTVTPRLLAANRANAQKSTGPKTLQGKLRSRFNRLTHGLTSTTACIPGEDPERYDFRRQEYVEIFQPQNIFEWELVDDLCSTRWRKQRAVRYETAITVEAVATNHTAVTERYQGISPPVEVGLALKSLADDSRCLDLLNRYETRLGNDAIRTWKHLQDVQQHRPPAADSPAATAGPPTPHASWPHEAPVDTPEPSPAAELVPPAQSFVCEPKPQATQNPEIGHCQPPTQEAPEHKANKPDTAVETGLPTEPVPENEHSQPPRHPQPEPLTRTASAAVPCGSCSVSR